MLDQYKYMHGQIGNPRFLPNHSKIQEIVYDIREEYGRGTIQTFYLLGNVMLLVYNLELYHDIITEFDLTEDYFEIEYCVDGCIYIEEEEAGGNCFGPNNLSLSLSQCMKGTIRRCAGQKYQGVSITANKYTLSAYFGSTGISVWNDTIELKTIATAVIFLLIASVLITIVTSVFMYQIIKFYQMPQETSHYAAQYLRLSFLGFVFVGMYNTFAFLLRSFGDSKSPLYFLAGSCISNIVLDLLFVLGLHMGVFGAALATFISQIASAVGCGIYAVKKMDFLKFEREDLVFSFPAFKKVFGYSVLTALQQSISSFGMMLIQGLVNTFGATVMASFAACSKVDSVANTPLQDLGNWVHCHVLQLFQGTWGH